MWAASSQWALPHGSWMGQALGGTFFLWSVSLHNGGRLEAQAEKGDQGLAFFHRPSHIPEPAFLGWQGEEEGRGGKGK